MRYFENKAPDFNPGSPVVIDKQNWLIQISQIAESIIEGMPATLDNCDGGLYVGNAGIAYMFYCLAQNEAFKDMRTTFLERAVMYTNVSQEYVKSLSRDRASFILGEAGVQAVSCLVYNATGSSSAAEKFSRKYADLSAICLPMKFLRCGSDELFVGRAGYLCGVINLQKKLGKSVLSEKIIWDICSVIVESGRKYVESNPSVPLMYAYYGTEYLGAAHGMSSILQMLLCFPSFLKSNPEIEKTVHAGVDYMLSLEQENYNYPPAMDEVKHHRPDKEELVHWCHGAPGVIYMLARAYKVWNDNKYLDACLRCGELTWRKGLLKKGPGICHGIAGSGYVFLLLYRLTVGLCVNIADRRALAPLCGALVPHRLGYGRMKTLSHLLHLCMFIAYGDQKHLYRALKFAEFLFTQEFQQARIPDSPYSLYEGWAGTVCFLADLLQPEKAEFPFFDVFVD